MNDQNPLVSITIQVPSSAPEELLGRLAAMAAELGAAGGIDQVILEVTRTCTVCGCTDETACFGGCWWVNDDGQPDLCSRCSHPLDETPHA